MSNLFERYAGALQLFFVVGVVGAALAISASLKPEKRFVAPSSAPDRQAVSVVAPEEIPFSPTISLNGVVQVRTVTNVIPQVAGRVIEVSPAFRDGAFVSQGDVLFVIDPSDYELAVERTLAEIEVARSDLLRLEAEGAAERKIWENRFPDRPIPALTARLPQIAAAKARVKSGEAARAAAELSLKRTIVRAPFDARVLDTRLDVGQVVASNVSVGSVFSVESLEIAAPVSAAELQRIGQPEGRLAMIESPSSNESSLRAKVVRKAASLDERTRLGTLYVRADEISTLTLGEFVTVNIAGESMDSAFRVPSAALTSRDQLWVVEDGVLTERRVEVLASDADSVITSRFDYADGIVAIPPADARAGLHVQTDLADKWASAGGMSGASK